MIQLLRDDGLAVEETTLTIQDVMSADEVFATGNYQKVSWCRKIDGTAFARGEDDR